MPAYTFSQPTVSGQLAGLLVPNAYSAAVAVPLVMFHHGATQRFNAPDTATEFATCRDALIAEGWIICCTDAHQDSWGNNNAIADTLALYQYMIANYSIRPGKVLHFSESMGGIVGLLTIAAGVVPCAGWAGVSPVTNLRNVWNGHGSLAVSIETAYGITPTADLTSYTAQTAGHDPALLAASKFANIPMRFYASLADGTIAQASNSFALRDSVRALSRTECTLRAATDDHTGSQQFQPSDLIQFYSRCIANAPDRTPIRCTTRRR